MADVSGQGHDVWRDVAALPIWSAIAATLTIIVTFGRWKPRPAAAAHSELSEIVISLAMTCGRIEQKLDNALGRLSVLEKERAPG
jgi:hypothetical protein